MNTGNARSARRGPENVETTRIANEYPGSLPSIRYPRIDIPTAMEVCLPKLNTSYPEIAVQSRRPKLAKFGDFWHFARH